MTEIYFKDTEDKPDPDSWTNDPRTMDLYQVISHLAEMANVGADDQVIRALDLAAYGKTKNDMSILPFNPDPEFTTKAYAFYRIDPNYQNLRLNTEYYFHFDDAKKHVLIGWFKLQDAEWERIYDEYTHSVWWRLSAPNGQTFYIDEIEIMARIY